MTHTAARHEPLIDVWSIDLDLPTATVERLSRTLSPDEQERAHRFRSADDARRYTVARGALREVLSRRVTQAADALRFDYSRFGKPELAAAQNAADVRFNVSGSHERALIAVTTGVAIGVDVEHVRPIADVDALVARFFSSEEISALSQLSEAERLDGFYTCWTRKEAYVKATGIGLSTPLDQFAVTVTPGRDPRILHVDGDREATQRWCLLDLSSDAAYRAALAVECRSAHLERVRWVPPAT